MTNALLAELDAELHAAFADADMADTGMYQPVVGVAQPCSVYVNRDVASVDLQGLQAHAGIVLVEMLRAGILVPPARGARITIDADGEVLSVDACLSTGDESLWRLVCHS